MIVMPTPLQFCIQDHRIFCFQKEIGAVLTAAQQAIDDSLKGRFEMSVGQTESPADECVPHAVHETFLATGHLDSQPNDRSLRCDN